MSIISLDDGQQKKCRVLMPNRHLRVGSTPGGAGSGPPRRWWQGAISMLLEQGNPRQGRERHKQGAVLSWWCTESPAVPPFSALKWRA